MAKDFGARFRIKPGDRVQLAKRDPADVSSFGSKSVTKSKTDKHAEALERIAKLSEEKLKDDEAAIKTLDELAKAYPDENHAGAAILRIARIRQRQAEARVVVIDAGQAGAGDGVAVVGLPVGEHFSFLRFANGVPVIPGHAHGAVVGFRTGVREPDA